MKLIGQPNVCSHAQYLYTFTFTTNSLVNSFIYIATSFEPKLGSSSDHNTRNWNIYRN